MVFENSETLPDELDNAALLQGEVMDEFDKLEEYVKEKIDAEESTEVASKNLVRNRYKDILPYDSNLVTLATPTGKLITTHVLNCKTSFILKYKLILIQFQDLPNPTTSMHPG